jgi:hypothetical protein
MKDRHHDDAMAEMFREATADFAAGWGAIARVPRAETPYVNRDALYDFHPISIWDDPADDEANVRWAREAWDAIRPFSTGGVYANNLGDEGEDRVGAAYGGELPKARRDQEQI